MKLPPYVDIHTHGSSLKRSPESIVSIVSLGMEEIISEQSFYEIQTAGIHPWWMEDYSSEEIERAMSSIEKRCKSRELWGVGETGIDRASPTSVEEQLKVFLWHISLSEEMKLPLIIHSVRSGSDILEILKKEKPLSPWIFHDFRGNEILVRDILRLHPGSYFSFGISIDNSPQVRTLLPSIPLTHLLLETDQQKHLDIHDIYLRVAHLLGIDLDLLKSQLWMNFNKVAST